MVVSLVRDALRFLRRSPVLSLVAVLSLAIGMTINATAFSVLDALVLRPLPIAGPDTLVRILSTSVATGSTDDLSYDDFLDVQRNSRTMAGLAAVETAGAAVDSPGEAPEIVVLGIVSANYFSVLGVSPRLGRVFGAADEDVSQGLPAAVISDAFWRRRFAADPGVVGRTIRLNTRDWTIVGVLPERFAGTQPVLPPAVWVPAASARASGRSLGDRSSRRFAVFGRLADGVALSHADAEMGALGATLAETFPEADRGRGLTAVFESRARVQDLQVLIWLAIAVVSLPLLIACANVAGLLIGRAEERRREMAIRLALGGSRGQLIRQLLSETAVLSALAVAASLVLAAWIAHAIPALLPPLPVEFNLDLRIDTRIGVATGVVAVAATLLAGLVPAFLAARADLTPVIKGHAASIRIGPRRLTLRNLLVTGQIAVMFLLLQMAALFTTSFLNATRLDPGFAPGAMAFATVAPGAAGYDRARTDEFFRSLLEQVRSEAGMEAAALARHLPLNGFSGGGATARVRIAGHQPPDGREAFAIRDNVVSTGYFQTIGIPLIRGRDFDARDRADGERVTIINQTMVNRFWPDEDPIGRRIELVPDTGADDSARACLIVGIVADTKYLTLNETTPPYMFFPLSQVPAGEMTVVARGRGSETALAGQVRTVITALDPGQPIMDVITRREHLRRALFGERTLAESVAGLGAISLMLAMVGMYGVVAFAVSRRTREIGLRMALGASTRRVIGDVLRHGAGLAVAGVILGAVVGAALGAVLAGSLYGVSATDPRMFVAAAALTLPMALAASALPARRASRINPIEALRE